MVKINSKWRKSLHLDLFWNWSLISHYITILLILNKKLN